MEKRYPIRGGGGGGGKNTEEEEEEEIARKYKQLTGFTAGDKKRPYMKD